MLNYSQNPYNVLSEIISFDNVQKMGEMLTLLRDKIKLLYCLQKQKKMKSKQSYKIYSPKFASFGLYHSIFNSSRPDSRANDTKKFKQQKLICFFAKNTEQNGLKIAVVY